MIDTIDIEAQRNESIVAPWVLTAGCILIFGAASAYFFRGVWNPLNTIEGTDAFLWVPMFVQTWTKGLFIPRWFPRLPLLGMRIIFHYPWQVE